MQKVWFFDVPTIGYCPECDEIAVYHDGRLQCPKCHTAELSVFVWNGQSKHPEHEVEEPEDINW